jgi:energy-coupling factor transport system substrate-specific component
MLTNLFYPSGNEMRVRDIVLIGLLSASVTAGKLALSFLPNIEIVTLLFMVFAISLGVKRSLLIAIVFVTTDIFLYGFSTWVIGYYIAWPLLVFIAAFAGKKLKSEYGYAIVAGLFGLFYGLLFAVVESFFYGPAYGLAYWIKGLTFDFVHGASNFIIVLFLFKPLQKVLTAQAARFLKTA